VTDVNQGSETGHRWRTAFAVMIPVLIADQLTKAWAVATLDDRTIDLVPTVSLRLTYNSGFSFGTGSGLGPLVGIVVAVIIVFIFVRLAKEHHPRRIVLMATILGGAIGNLLDRLFRTDGGWPMTGEVVDFVDVSWYAVFNVADAALVCAVIAFIATEIFDQRRHAVGSSPR
jgi:signal peptidase II